MSRIEPLPLSSPPPSDRLFARTIPVPVVLVILGSLIVKLCLIQLNQGEYTDGIIQLQLWKSPVVFFPPGYTFLCGLLNRLTGDLLLSGRLVSILASIGSLLMFYYFARLILKLEREAFWATLFLALSPIFNRWSLRVMTDSLFCFLFITNCYFLFDAVSNPKRSLAVLLGFTGLTTLVRYQGLYFFPFVLLLVLKKYVKFNIPFLYNLEDAEKYNTQSSVFRPSSLFLHTFYFCLSLVPWLILLWWWFYRGFGHAQQFEERASHGLAITSILYFNMFETFILYWPWATTYGLFILALLGCRSLAKGSTVEKGYLGFSVVTGLVFLIVQSAFLSFQYRYLLPLVPLWCLLAGRGVSALFNTVRYQAIRWGFMVLVIANLLFMTLAVWHYQRATFGDLVESAKFLRSIGLGARVLSDESYRAGVYNVKMQFWSGREILYYSVSSPRESQTEPRAGDILVLHNSYTDIAAAAEKLKAKFDLVVLKRWSSETDPGEFVTIPLLPDIMVSPSYLTSNPPCMAR